LESATFSKPTIAYVNLKDGKAASGTLIEVGERIFLATTAHSIPRRPVGTLSFVGNTATKIDRNIPPILSYAKEPDYQQRDVAYVELDREFVEVTFGKAAIPLQRVYPCATGQDNWWTIVAGYPCDEIRSIQEVREQAETKLFTLECWGNKLLMLARWNALGKRHRSPDERLDVFIPRPIDDDFVALGPLQNQKPGQLSEPFGMSGGGYWQPNLALTTRLWSPEHYSLIAIQSHWWGRGRYLQGTQIIHWLRLLWEHQADVRQFLENAFPDHDLAG
jgi:hypothetical protein